MATDLAPADIEKVIRALTVAEKTNLGIEVTLPVAFGDGDLVSVVIEQASDGFVVHDFWHERNASHVCRRLADEARLF